MKLLDEAASICAAGKRVLLSNGRFIAKREDVDQRKAICSLCVHWDERGFHGWGKCRKCGCSALKLYLATEKCPIGRWPEAVDK